MSPADARFPGYAGLDLASNYRLMRRTPYLSPVLSAVLALGAMLPAQVAPTTSATAPPVASPQGTDVVDWKEDTSRQLFTACDDDGDDSLDLLEYCAAFDLAVAPAARDRFRRIDRDSNGFLDWPEFDAYCKGFIRDGNVLHLVPSRTVEADRKELQPAAPATPAQSFLQLFDTDASGDLSREEFDKLLETAGLPATLAARFTVIDSDGSKTLSTTELAPMLSPKLLDLVVLATRPRTGTLLPAPNDTFDLDADGSLDIAELTAALRRTDSDLAVHAAGILAKLDKDRDGKLGAAELAPAAPGAAEAQLQRPSRR